MNKTELIDFISEKVGITKAAAFNALEAILEGITLSLQNGDPVVLLKFGTFVVKKRAPREGRNPSTGEKIKIKAAKVVGFKAGKGLKDAVKDSAKEDN
ncbi:MAG: HU family DNA-binding protein [Gammaproteobacteria bacterium]|nr:HU family DNA-binding protein [Gammaproteobacteria bacterium]